MTIFIKINNLKVITTLANANGHVSRWSLGIKFILQKYEALTLFDQEITQLAIHSGRKKTRPMQSWFVKPLPFVCFYCFLQIFKAWFLFV